MMDAVKYLKEKTRMIDSLGGSEGSCIGASCTKCPLSENNNRSTLTCYQLERFNPEKAVEIVERWAAEHPARTMIMDFMEKYPNAPLDKDGKPNICPYELGYEEEFECDFYSDCVKCWDRPIKEDGEQE